MKLVIKINYPVKNTLGNIFQATLTIFLFLIIVDIVLLAMESIFPFQPFNRLTVAKYDLIVSILLIFFVAVNYILFEKTKRLLGDSLFIIILAVIPFEFIFLSIFGH